LEKISTMLRHLHGRFFFAIGKGQGGVGWGKTVKKTKEHKKKKKKKKNRFFKKCDQ